MKVYVWPIFKGNPYQHMLHRALEEQGVTLVDTLEEADVMHLHWLHPVLNGGKRTTAARTLQLLRKIAHVKRHRKTLIWTVHNLADHHKRRPVVDRWLRRVVARSADALIVHGPNAAKIVGSTFGRTSSVRVMEHPSFIDCYTNNHRLTRAALTIPEKATVFAVIGYLAKYKGLDTILSCWHHHPPDAWLLIAGQAHNISLHKQLQTFADEHQNVIYRTGYVAEEDLACLVSSVDALLLPYQQSLSSGSAVLAMSFGASVVGPKIGALQDALGDHVPLYDEAQGFCDALNDAAQHPQTLREQGATLLEVAKSRTWEKAAATLISVYGSAL